jgi:hypothetical protein
VAAVLTFRISAIFAHRLVVSSAYLYSVARVVTWTHL